MSDLFLFQLAGLVLLGFGLYGLTARRTLVGMLIGVELMLCGAGLSLAAAGQLGPADPAQAQMASLLVMGLAAAEATLVLAVIVVVVERAGDARVEDVNRLKG